MASKNIKFDTIPSSIRKPLVYSEFNTKLALNGLSANRQKMVIVAPKTSAGTAPALVPVDIFSDDQAALLAGPGSIAHQMAVAALKANRYLALSMVLVDDAPLSIKGEAVLAVSLEANGPGVLRFSIGAEDFQIPVNTASTPISITETIVRLVNQNSSLGFTASAQGATVIFVAKNSGTLSQKIVATVDMSRPDHPVGISLYFINPQSNKPFLGGAIDADITPALTAIFSAGNKLITSAFTDAPNMLRLRSHLAETGNSIELRGAFAWAGATDTLAQATGLATSLGDPRMGVALLRGTRSAPWAVAAAMAAVDAYEEDPARPLNTLELAGLDLPPVPAWLGRNEQETCLYSGVTPLEVGPGGRVQVVRAITTYIVNALNAPDMSLLDRTTIKTLDYFRQVVTNDQKIRFSREKITERTLRAVRVRAIELALQLEDLEILRDVMKFIDDFIVEIDLQDPTRIDMKIPAPVVPGLMVLASRFDLYLQY